MQSIQDLIPRSRINLRYRTMIEGKAKELELPFRLMVLADLSLGSSRDRENDLETRRMRTLDGPNLDPIMEDMKMSISFATKNLIEGGADELDVTLPIKSRKSFTPAEIAANVPKIRSLLLMRKLLLEMQSHVDNRKDIRNLINQIFSNSDDLKQLQKDLEAYSGYRLPAGQSKTLPAAGKP